MSTYAVLDERIIAHVTTVSAVHPMYARHVLEEAERIAEATGRYAFRIIDGRLSALKASGRILFCRSTGLWLATPTSAGSASSHEARADSPEVSK